MEFKNIVLTTGEEALLREMLNGKAMDKATDGMQTLINWKLALPVHRIVPAKSPLIQCMITKDGEKYIRYLDIGQSAKVEESKHRLVMDALEIVGVVASVIAAIASIISLVK